MTLVYDLVYYDFESKTFTINAIWKQKAWSSSRVSNLKKSYKKIRKILLVNAPKGRILLLTSAYCFEIVIIVYYRHTMGFQIVTL